MNPNSNILTAFNKHFTEFVDDVLEILPGNGDILAARTIFNTIKKGNPRLLIKIWFDFVAIPYKNEIETGDVEFFVKKDYSNDVSSANNSKQIMDAIDKIKTPIKNMTKSNQDKSIKYIQNLSKLATMYHC